MDTSIFKQRATYKTFIALLDNYNAETGVTESVSSSERHEVMDFIHAAMQTKPMQYCHLYCHAKNPDVVPASSKGFADLLYTIWFELYHRQHGQLDSSGFGT
jgi:poly(U)-specific endoribonuclease